MSSVTVAWCRFFGRETQPARARLRELLHNRLTFAAIATTLNAEGFTTATGLAWGWRHVQKTRDSLAPD
ncbi:MAG: hypothetical protein JWL72_4434 [Ilumatobacteraceae bacterium]|nr:hypothetical protein [Ilumatobacteraceae bacterium]MCU1391096.1 hypothetical protein [Ilumatobacteraceae bacterium]